jgi:hypothetical protein
MPKEECMGTRWDAVVHGSQFWSEPESRSLGVVEAGESVSVHVWLFGWLAGSDVERPLTLTMGSPFCIRQVIAEIGRRGGDGLVAKMMAPDGSKQKYCRVFIDGQPASDLDAPVSVRKSPAQVEIILLTGIEGG